MEGSASTFDAMRLLTTPTKPGIEIKGVSQQFSKPRKRGSSEPAVNTVIRDINLTIPRGHFTAVVGPSGCGKTTLLNLISGLLAPTSGQVFVSGELVKDVRHDVGYMPARDALLPWRTVQRNVELPLEIQKVDPRVRGQKARELLSAVGLGGFETHHPYALSHGMRQRTNIARTFISDPEILLMDEPFSALDAQTRVHVQGLFLSMWEASRSTVVLITHDVMEAVALADTVVVFSHAPGRIKAIYDIDLPRPRSVENLLFDSPEFQGYIRQIWNDLRPDGEA